MTSMGGDCFAIVAEPDGTLHGLNGSGRSPAALSTDSLAGGVENLLRRGTVRTGESRLGHLDVPRAVLVPHEAVDVVGEAGTGEEQHHPKGDSAQPDEG